MSDRYELSFQGRDEVFQVRRFTAQEGLSKLFSLGVWMVTELDDADLDGLVGAQAGFRVQGFGNTFETGRFWTGVCTHIELTRAESTGLSGYYAHLAPRLWLLTQRRNYTIWQGLKIKDIVAKILSQWNIEATWQIDDGAYPTLDYRVQYGESDFAFISRLLEEAGISFFFKGEGGKSSLVLTDEPHRAAPTGEPLQYLDEINSTSGLHATALHRATHVRPGAHKIRDYDFRNPAFQLFGAAAPAPPEDKQEQFYFQPGASVIQSPSAGGGTPNADARGAARSDQKTLDALAQRRLDGDRGGKKTISFKSNFLELYPGAVTAVKEHPRADLGEAHKLLVTETELVGELSESLNVLVKAVFADGKFRPPALTPKPVVHGLQSGLVVGPSGQEIHTDELGRICVQFAWDREGQSDEKSSTWIRVSQGWAGVGYGIICIPRVGQEVLVGFLEGDPDQPVVVGRMFNSTQQVPYKLPDHKTISTWKSDSSPGSGGYNELKFEDAKGAELVYIQAERDLQKLVKHDEREVTRENRLVSVGLQYTQVIGGDETLTTLGNRKVLVGGDSMEHIKGGAKMLVDGDAAVTVSGGLDVCVGGKKREMVGSFDLSVAGPWKQKVASLALTVYGNDAGRCDGTFVREATGRVGLKAGSEIVLSAPAICLKTAGGFITIDAGGVTIVGTVVKINSGGSALGDPGAATPLPSEPTPVTADDPSDEDQKPGGSQFIPESGGV